MPLSTVCSKDSVSQELLPFLMKQFALAILWELRSQDSLNVLWIRCKYNSDVSHYKHLYKSVFYLGCFSEEWNTLSSVRALR
jgi:hypothetical protein